MPMMPFQILGLWLRGLLSIALLGLGIYLVRHFYEEKRPATVAVHVPARAERDADRDTLNAPAAVRREVVVHRPGWQLGWDRETAFLIAGLALIAGSLGAGSLASRLVTGTATKDAHEIPSDWAERIGAVQRVRRPDGAELHAVVLGPEDAPALVLTHGWGCDCSEWKYSLPRLAEHHRVILWDLPGSGRSTRHPDNDFSLETMARDLDAVADLAAGRPVTLVGHSIGGMINLTYCRLFPDNLGPKVAGLVQVHTTFTNPVETTEWSGLYRALQKPVLEPLCYLMIGLAPLAWAMNRLSYWNGSAHHSSHRSSFSGSEPWNKLDFVTRFLVKTWPATLARGMLAMFRHDAKGTLATIPVPCLVIAGDRDTTTMPWSSGVMAESIPDARLENMERMKHQGHLENDEEFVRLIEGFVGQTREGRIASTAGAVS